LAVANNTGGALKEEKKGRHVRLWVTMMLFELKGARALDGRDGEVDGRDDDKR
jgi:hypothetical protein